MKKTPIRLYCIGKKYTLKMFLIAIFQFRLYYDARLNTVSCTTTNTCCHTEFRPAKHLMMLPLMQATCSLKQCCSWMFAKSMCETFDSPIKRIFLWATSPESRNGAFQERKFFDISLASFL